MASPFSFDPVTGTLYRFAEGPPDPTKIIRDANGNIIYDPSKAPPSQPSQLSSSSSNEDARQRFARVTREQWADYLSRFGPIENKLISAYDNPKMRNADIAAARGLATGAFDTASRGSLMEAARFGMAGELESDKAFQRKMNMGRVAADVDAANETRRHDIARDQYILTGGISGPEAKGVAT